MTNLVDIILITMLAATGFALVRVRNLFAVTMLFGIYSLLTASLFVLLDAVDVALTEAAVGAGISVILLLATLAMVGKEEKVTKGAQRPVLALIVVVVTGAALVYGTLDMPLFGDPEAPAHQHVAPRYVDTSPTEIGIPNMVTSVLASYRGFDTLGEVLVIFAAGVGVLILLGAGLRDSRPEGRSHDGGLTPAAQGSDPSSGVPSAAQGSDPKGADPGLRAMRDHIVLRVVAKLLMPMILLFGLYIQLHGEYSPGGGFQAGIIFAASFVLYALIFGLGAAQQVLSPRVAHGLAAFGAVMYLAVGLTALAMGGNFLEYKVLHEVAQVGETVGIIVIELGVGVTVAGVALTLFYSFVGRKRSG